MDINERLRSLEKDVEYARQEAANAREEARLCHAQNLERIRSLETKLSYYDKMALRWGGICLGAVAVGAMVGGHLDNLKSKILAWLL